MPEIMPIKTVGEWDAEIKQHSLHLKHDSQLFFLEEMLEGKIPRVNRDLMEILFFPDAKKKEICENYIQSGEVTNYFDLDTPVPISLEDQKKIDDEYQHEVGFYTTKVSWLREKLTCCQKEMELRADRKVARIPKGTPYFVDFDNGHDVNNDGTTATKTNGDGPWATLDKATSVLAAGDVCTVRRGMTQAVSQDLAFANDGTIVAPITITADYSNTWSGDVNLSATGTATLTFGSKTITFSADVSGVLAAGDWIYAASDAATDFSYEVASVSTVTVTLYLPYKGAQAGSGKTMTNMGAAPIWNTAAGDYECNLDSDDYWKFQGLHLRGTDTNGTVEIDSAGGQGFKDCILEGNGSADNVMKFTDDCGVVVLRKCRFFNYYYGIHQLQGGGAPWLEAYDCLFDGDNTASSGGLFVSTWHQSFLNECELKNHAAADLVFVALTGNPYRASQVKLRNCILSSGTEISYHQYGIHRQAFSEDHDGTVGDNRQLNSLSTAEGTPSTQSETTKVRAGGGASSIKVTPSANIDTDWELSRILLFEYPVYAVKDVEKTYTVYLSSDDDTDWDADPLNTELWIEAEYWGHATNVHRKILKSTEVCNNFNADDTVWDTLTVTVTPLQTGVLYLRGYYCKTKEATNSNIFFCDTKIGVA